jgi:oligopeptide/dipeptide ABC transporter ATP-binding protein
MSDTPAPVLEVEDLRVRFRSDSGLVTSVDGLSFQLLPGETLGVVGESGSGKSVTSMAVMGLLPKAAQVSGSIRLRGEELLGKSEHDLQTLRGRRIAMIFQDALAALNPVHTVGEQLMEAVRVHDGRASRSRLRARAVELLDTVGIPSPEQRVDQFPHEFSGGMRQRIMIAMSIANDPDVLIADEPTTALDVTVQAQVLDVLRRIQERTGSAMLLITHDLGVVAGLADRVLVMYAGKMVEQAPVEPIVYETAHPYTIGLLDSMPRVDQQTGSELFSIPGMPPKPTDLPAGCRFSPRCAWAVAGLCDVDDIPVSEISPLHSAACLRLEAVREARHGGAS